MQSDDRLEPNVEINSLLTFGTLVMLVRDGRGAKVRCRVRLDKHVARPEALHARTLQLSSLQIWRVASNGWEICFRLVFLLYPPQKLTSNNYTIAFSSLENRDSLKRNENSGKMPPAKRTAQEDSRSDASTVRERQIAAAAHARSKKQAAATTAVNNGSALKELALVSTESGNVVVPGQNAGVSSHPRAQPAVVVTLLTPPRCNGILPTENSSTLIASHITSRPRQPSSRL